VDPTFKAFQLDWLQIALKRAVRFGNPAGKLGQAARVSVTCFTYGVVDRIEVRYSPDFTIKEYCKK
jgi:hypothetical protein